MKLSKNVLLVFAVLIVAGALYRIIPGRPWGFAPHIAMALFGGAVIKDKKWAFALPIFSLFLSDLLYQVLYINGLSDTAGFYQGQWSNYLLFFVITILGSTMRNINVGNVISYSFLAPTVYFLLSNFSVWIGGGGYQRPKTFAGLMQCYADGLPFFQGGLMATLVFGGVFFSLYFFLRSRELSEAKA